MRLLTQKRTEIKKIISPVFSLLQISQFNIINNITTIKKTLICHLKIYELNIFFSSHCWVSCKSWANLKFKYYK